MFNVTIVVVFWGGTITLLVWVGCVVVCISWVVVWVGCVVNTLNGWVVAIGV